MIDLTTGAYLVGALVLAFELAACALAAAVVVSRSAPHLVGLGRALALFLWTTTFLAFVHLLPGIFGVLTREAVLVCSALLGAAAAVVWSRRPAPVVASADDERFWPGTLEPRWSYLLAAAGALSVTWAAVAFLVAKSPELVTAVDATTIHLPVVARWIQAQSVWPIVQYTPDLSNGTYPENGTLMLLAAVLPWRSIFLARYVDVFFLTALAAAVAALARELRAPASASVLAGAAVTAMAAVNGPALAQAQVDAPMLAWFAIGALFLLRAARSGSTAEFVFAGVGLGMALGTKWYALPDVPIVLVAAVAATFVLVRSLRGLLRPGLIVVGVAALTGGFWLLRNTVKVGDPLYPAPVHLFGITIFSAPPDEIRERSGFTISDYLFDGHIWRHYFVPAFRDNFGILGPLVLLALVCGTVVALMQWRRGGERRALVRLLAVAFASLVMAVVYLKLPDTAFGPPGLPILVGANSRYLVPALMGALVVAAWLAGQGPRWRVVVEVALAVGIADGLIRSYEGVGAKAALAGLVVVAALAAVAWLWPRAHAELGPKRFALATAASLLLVLVLGGWAARHRLEGQSYGQGDPAVAWIDKNARSGRTIAVGKTWAPAGVSPVTAAFGPHLDNRVVYLGRYVDGTLRSWKTRGPFAQQVQRDRVDAIVLGTGAALQPAGAEPEASWARSLGFRQAAASRRLVLFVDQRRY